jgi:hypothetical protein
MSPASDGDITQELFTLIEDVLRFSVRAPHIGPVERDRHLDVLHARYQEILNRFRHRQDLDVYDEHGAGGWGRGEHF